MVDPWMQPYLPTPARRRWPKIVGWIAVGVVAVVVWCVMAGFGVMWVLKMQHARRVVPAAETAHTDFSTIKGQFPANTVTINQDFPAHSCAHLYASEKTWRLGKAECGAPEDNYIVVQQTRNRDECVADVDYKFWSTTADGHDYAVCMDYHWLRDTCLSITREDSHRANCDDASQPGREKPVRLVLDTTNLFRCPDGGFAHPVRKFSVCTETQK
ncbi:hypothetical protein [Mycobacteroides abscessus]|uniref:hypothetical protein n=1 Tax=Mycobacteroides abscessus TaxID=36809 RepID=UPI001F24888E|nr:hypothetical protein [Mycobacteroides abscessus]